MKKGMANLKILGPMSSTFCSVRSSFPNRKLGTKLGLGSSDDQCLIPLFFSAHLKVMKSWEIFWSSIWVIKIVRDQMSAAHVSPLSTLSITFLLVLTNWRIAIWQNRGRPNQNCPSGNVERKCFNYFWASLPLLLDIFPAIDIYFLTSELSKLWGSLISTPLFLFVSYKIVSKSFGRHLSSFK